MSYFILYLEENLIKAALAELPDGADRLPEFCIYAQRRYQRVHTESDSEGRRELLDSKDLGDYDHLVTANKQLAGFAFVIEHTAKFRNLSLVKRARNVTLENGAWLKFALADDGHLSADGAQVLGTEVYCGGASDYILALHVSWPSTRPIAFPIETENAPAFLPDLR